MVSVICSAVLATIAAMSAIYTIYQWVDAVKKKEKRKKELVVFGIAAVISTVLALLSTPQARNVIEDYNTYQEEAAAQQTEYAQSLMLAQEYIQEGSLFEAIQQLQKIPSHSENYEEASELLASTSEIFRSNTINEAEHLSREGRYTEAINVIQTAKFLLPEDDDFAVKEEKYRINLAKNIVETASLLADEYIRDADCKSAVLTIQKALEECPDSQELKVKMSTYESEYIKQVLSVVSDYVAEHKIDSAVDMLNDALSILPDHTSLEEKLEVCKDIRENLSDLTYLNQSGYFDDRDVIAANDGTLLKNGFIIGQSGSSRTYAIDGNYSAITGVFALAEESKNNTARCVITISVDSREYVLDEVRAGIRPVPFDINLTNAQNITFTIFSEDDWSRVVVGDTILYKTVQD